MSSEYQVQVLNRGSMYITVPFGALKSLRDGYNLNIPRPVPSIEMDLKNIAEPIKPTSHKYDSYEPVLDGYDLKGVNLLC